MPGLQDFEPQPEFVPGFHVEPAADDPPGFRVGATDIVHNRPADDTHNWLFDYNPDVGNPPAVGIPPGGQPSDEEDFYPVPPPVYDPVYFPEPPQDRIKEALDQIVRIYGEVRPDPFFGRPTSHTSRVLADDANGNRRPSPTMTRLIRDSSCRRKPTRRHDRHRHLLVRLKDQRRHRRHSSAQCRETAASSAAARSRRQQSAGSDGNAAHTTIVFIPGARINTGCASTQAISY